MALSLSNLVRRKSDKPAKIAIYGPGGIGKAQPLNSKIQTPNGPIEMGKIKVGDVIFGADGKTQTVLAVYPQGIQDTYKITFRDGSSTACNLDHLWRVNTRKVRNVVMTTEEIAEFIERHGTGYSLRIPCNPCVEYPEREVPLDPYLLGIYLAEGYGLGSVVQLTICDEDPDILKEVRRIVAEAGHGISERPSSGCTQVNITLGDNARGESMVAKISAIGLDVKSTEKFIPDEYKYNSKAVRLALLRGLMDGDGCFQNGRVTFSTCSDRLARDLSELVQSLGGKAVRNFFKRDGKNTEWSVNVRMDENPFSCERKAGVWYSPENNRMYRNIDRVEYVGQTEQQCIRVSNNDSLYLTDEYIVTHNTTLASEFPNPIFIQTEDGGGALELTTFADEPLTSFDLVNEALEALATEEHDFRTLVVDSVTRLEPLVWAETCKRNNWKSIEDPGYGRGYVEADAVWREFLAACTWLRDNKGMTIVLIGHEDVRSFSDPVTDSYDRYQMRLHKRAEALIREDVDVLGFMNQVTTINREKTGFNKETAKARGSGQVALNLTPRPAFQAKNRFGMPDRILINPGEGYAALAPHLPGGSTNAAKAA